jgi:hypothetical protein
MGGALQALMQTSQLLHLLLRPGLGWQIAALLALRATCSVLLLLLLLLLLAWSLLMMPCLLGQGERPPS